ncbi:sigma-70 region 4 domain-containing protein [Streptomyces sp. RS10V-4]|uniref:sigma-70 region 4 domain-containing protein n=1 Tax=Streptomyces rhizoryzae TaxID=2932493 RepID=UPI0020029DEC|nr:sigma-70 region 4 domain-containing protein [Streptomyces rhizoryzae]MCK7625240.1 sigma-70 region 4 domain-containing protein [Streptomyces rhizoryzae]
MSPAPARTPARRPAITLPPAFEAFCALYCERYFGYALAHLPEPDASRVLGEAMGEVAVHWADLVRRPNPAACAWALVSARIRQRGGGPRPGAGDLAARRRPEALRQPALEYDAFVLHDVLGHSVAETAEVMGEEASRVRYALAAGRHRARPGAGGTALPGRAAGTARNTPAE